MKEVGNEIDEIELARAHLVANGYQCELNEKGMLIAKDPFYRRNPDKAMRYEVAGYYDREIMAFDEAVAFVIARE